LTMG